ncbi:unnamed protein product [Durusdinium trenchii]|uniref:Protein NLRC3 n=1 Tax=Durusdinium trenchii TaxID=1381693 RepID=A0ABP0PAM9_9DINO
MAHSGVQLLAMLERGCSQLRCNFCPLTPAELGSLGRRLRGSLVTSLDLCYCDLGPPGLTAFATALEREDDENRGRLEELKLGANGLGVSGAAVAGELCQTLALQRLDLEINELHDEGIRAFAQKALGADCSLQHLDLGMNGIHQEGAQALASSLKFNRSLTYLDLSFNCLGPQGALALRSALEQSHLQVLRLEDNNLSDEAALSLLQLPLRDLELGFNQVTAEGAVQMAKRLWTAKGPSRLGLAGNRLRDAGAAAFAAAIQKNCCLEELALPSNEIATAGGAALAAAMQCNWRLRELDLRENPISPEAAHIIAETTACARLASGSVPRTEMLRSELETGMSRRFCRAWSVRAYLSWLTKDAADTPQLAQLVASALASALVDGEGSAYDLARLKDLAQLYGRQLASKPRSERLTPRPRLGEPIGSAPGQRAWVRGVYLVNLTPFSLVISSQGSHLTLEEGTSGSLDAHAEHGLSLKLMHKTARELQQLEQMTLRPALGETSVPLNGPGGILRVLTSRHCAGTYQGECVVLLWSWPYRLRGVRFHDLNYYWNTAMATVGSSLTTPEAIRQVFRPDTLLQQCSLAELHTPGPAQSFVSHAWCLQVNEVFVALARAFAGAEMMRFWIAAFSLNHWCLEEHHGLVSDVLRSRNCQSLAVILGPQAETLKRLWCLYEVLLASDGRPERPGKMALKLCSPQGVLNVGTGGMPVSYILKVSGAINNLNLHQAECNQSDEELRNETFRRRLALHPIASCNAQLRSFMSEGLSSLHQRGQEIFLRASACLQGKGETDLDGRSETAADSDAAGSAVLSDKQCEQHVKEEQADEQLAEEILEKKMEGSFSREMEDGGRRPPVAGALPVLPNQDEHRSRSASRCGHGFARKGVSLCHGVLLVVRSHVSFDMGSATVDMPMRPHHGKYMQQLRYTVPCVSRQLVVSSHDESRRVHPTCPTCYQHPVAGPFFGGVSSDTLPWWEHV